MEDSTNPENLKFLGDLQKASEEIEADIRKKRPISRSQPPTVPPPKEQAPEKDYKPPTTLPARGGAPKTGLGEAEEVKVENEILTRDWISEIIAERQKFEKVYGEIESLRRKTQQRLERIKNLEANFSRVKNELTHFQQLKKENQAFLEEIKNMLKKENE